MHNYVVPPKKPEPKPKAIDCTNDPAIIEAAKLETVEFHGPIGAWKDGRFLVDPGSLKQYQQHMTAACG
jgi:hypothetical protein